MKRIVPFLFAILAAMNAYDAVKNRDFNELCSAASLYSSARKRKTYQ